MLERTKTDRALSGAIVLLVGAAVFAAYTAVRPLRRVTLGSEARTVQRNAAAPAPELSEKDLEVVWRGRDPDWTPASQTPGGSARPATEAPSFKLRGVIFATDGASCAFIESAGRIGLYEPGATIDGWKIAGIEVGKVRVVRGEEECTLQVEASYVSRPLPRVNAPAGDQGTYGATAASDRAQSASGPDDGRASAKLAPGTVSPAPVSGGRTVRPPPSPVAGADGQVAVPRELVQTIRNDPQSVRFGVRYTPEIAPDGTMRGYAIDHVEPGSLAARYGLAPGDRILAVNGIPLDSPARIVQLYQRFRNSDSVRVRLQRGGSVREYVYFVK